MLDYREEKDKYAYFKTAMKTTDGSISDSIQYDITLHNKNGEIIPENYDEDGRILGTVSFSFNKNTGKIWIHYIERSSYDLGKFKPEFPHLVHQLFI